MLYEVMCEDDVECVLIVVVVVIDNGSELVIVCGFCGMFLFVCVERIDGLYDVVLELLDIFVLCDDVLLFVYWYVMMGLFVVYVFYCLEEFILCDCFLEVMICGLGVVGDVGVMCVMVVFYDCCYVFVCEEFVIVFEGVVLCLFLVFLIDVWFVEVVFDVYVGELD